MTECSVCGDSKTIRDEGGPYNHSRYGNEPFCSIECLKLRGLSKKRVAQLALGLLDYLTHSDMSTDEQLEKIREMAQEPTA